MQTNDGDYVTEFQQNLESASKLLEKCSSLESTNKDLPAASKLNSLQLSNTMDASVLVLSRAYLEILEAQSRMKSASRAVANIENEASRRMDMAAEAGDDFDQILNSYSGEIDVDINVFSGAVQKAELKQYARFCDRLLASRRSEETMPEELCKLLYNEYKMQQNKDDEDVSIGESVVRPICPLSSKPLEEPVRAPCGHHFSKEYILAALAANQNNCKCPYTGCRVIITPTVLVRDPLKDFEVRQWLREEDRQRLEDTQLMTQV